MTFVPGGEDDGKEASRARRLRERGGRAMSEPQRQTSGDDGMEKTGRALDVAGDWRRAAIPSREVAIGNDLITASRGSTVCRGICLPDTLVFSQ